MSSRSFSTLLVLFAAITFGVVWFFMQAGRTGESSETSSSAAAPGRDLGSTSPTGELTPVEVEPAASSPARESVSAHPDPDLELRDVWWVEGRVILPPGTPPDEHVAVIAFSRSLAPRSPHRASIGPDGSFRVAFARGTSIGFLSLDARYLFLPSEMQISPSSQETGIELRPILGGCVRGRVVLSPDAKSLEPRLVGFLVDLLASFEVPLSLSAGASNHGAEVDENLSFEAHGVPPGHRSLSIRLPGIVQPRPTRVKVEPGHIHEVVIELVAGANVGGIVVDPAGAPIERARVSARVWADPGDPTSPETQNASGPNRDGRFLLQDLAPGRVVIHVEADGWVEPDTTSLVVLPGQTIPAVRIVLHPAGRIAGRVLAEDGTSWEEAMLILQREDEPVTSSTERPRPGVVRYANWMGRFEFLGLRAGSYRLQASDRYVTFPDERYEGSVRRTIVLAEGDSVDEIELLLPTPGRVTGRVTGPDGEGLGGVLVLPRGETWTWCEGGLLPKTYGDGRFAIERLPRGPVTITARARSLVLSAEVHATVRAGETTEVELALVAGTRLRFTAETASKGSQPLEFVARDDHGREWMLLPGYLDASSEEQREEEWTDPSYGPLPHGRYEIRATSRDGRKWSGSANLRGEAEVTVFLKLGP